MLFVDFWVGPDRFAVEAARVVEVLPLVHWKAVPDPPPGVVGMINYRRAPIAVLDLALLMFGRPSEQRMNTRIILVVTAGYASASGREELMTSSANDDAHSAIIGIVAERVMGAVQRDPSAFVQPDRILTTAPYLGPVLTEEPGIVQWMDVGRLLTDMRLATLAQPTDAQ